MNDCAMLKIMKSEINWNSELDLFLCSLLFLKGDSLQNLSNGLDTISYRVPLVRSLKFSS